MLYCYHCGKQIDEEKIEAQSSSLVVAENATSAKDVKIEYVCPRCGHKIHKGCTTQEKKDLACAAHAQVQRGNNSFASGMSKVCLGVIFAALALIFFLLSRKATNEFKITINCAEFWIFIVLSIISVILLSIGLVYVVTGRKNKNHYESLLKDLNNETFVQ